MNKLEEEIKDSIYMNGSKDDGNYILTLSQLEQVGREAKIITTDVAVKFAEFLCTYPDKNRNVHGEILHAKSKYDDADTTKNLFDEFINNHYGRV